MKQFIGNLQRMDRVSESRQVQQVAADHGVELSLKDAQDLWLMYSESMAAGWMMFPDTDEEIWSIIDRYLEEPRS